jgi:hypothetical protein
MQSQQTIAAFFDWLSTKIDPAFVCRLRDEWTSVPMRCNFGLIARDPSEWPQLVDEYDERVGLIAEGREATVEDMVAAWMSTLAVNV